MKIHSVSTIFTYKLYKQNLFTHQQIKEIKYGMEVMFSELSKFITYIVIFSLLGKTYEFVIVSLILFSLRGYSGGIHFYKYSLCFIFSFIFMLLPIIILPLIDLPFYAYYILSFFSILIIYIYSPITSVYRPIQSKKRKIFFKYLSLTVSTLWIIILFVFLRDSQVFKSGIWIIVLQALQLILAKVKLRGDFNAIYNK